MLAEEKVIKQFETTNFRILSLVEYLSQVCRIFIRAELSRCIYTTYYVLWLKDFRVKCQKYFLRPP